MQHFLPKMLHLVFERADQYEHAVLDYLCARPDRFVNWQFTIPFNGFNGGSCPDFLVLDFAGNTVYVVEVSTTFDCAELVHRAREKETRWFGSLKDHLKKLNPVFANWDLHVTLFVRDEEVSRTSLAVQEFLDVSVISLTKVVFGWNWNWQPDNFPINTLRDANKSGRVHAI
jgi:hypothetical protein